MNDWIERNRGHLIVLLLSLILNGALVVILHRPMRSTIQLTPSTPSPTPDRLRVYVSGAVAAPDVYELARGSLVRDALQAAGGGTDDADLSTINLAQEIKDQMQVNIPSRATAKGAPLTQSGATPALPDSAEPPLGASGKVNVNTAGAAELESLPGIGPALAVRIIEYRTQNGPFASIDALKEVKGIGEATFGQLKDRIEVQ